MQNAPRAMGGEKATRLTLEFDSRTEPISGRMRDETGTSRAFSGWLGLAAALGSILRSRGSAGGAATRPQRVGSEPER
jgi:hypothetical protein